MHEEHRVVELVRQVERRPRRELQRVERELRPALRWDEEPSLDASVDLRCHLLGSRDAAHLREHRREDAVPASATVAR